VLKCRIRLIPLAGLWLFPFFFGILRGWGVAFLSSFLMYRPVFMFINILSSFPFISLA